MVCKSIVFTRESWKDVYKKAETGLKRLQNMVKLYLSLNLAITKYLTFSPSIVDQRLTEDKLYWPKYDHGTWHCPLFIKMTSVIN